MLLFVLELLAVLLFYRVVETTDLSIYTFPAHLRDLATLMDSGL